MAKATTLFQPRCHNDDNEILKEEAIQYQESEQEPGEEESFLMEVLELLKEKVLERGWKEAISEVLWDTRVESWKPMLKHYLAQLNPEDSDIFLEVLFNSEEWFRSRLLALEKEENLFRVRLGSGIWNQTEPTVTSPERPIQLEVKWPHTISKEELLQAFFDNQLDIDKWVQLFSGLAPFLVLKLESLALPPIESFSGSYSVLLENLVLNCLNLDSNHFEIEVLPETQRVSDPHSNFRLPSSTSRTLRLNLNNVQAEARNVNVAFEKKVGFPKFSDEGLLDLIIPKDSLSISILLEVEVDPTKLLAQLQGLDYRLLQKDPVPLNPTCGIVEDIFSIHHPSQNNSSPSLDQEPLPTKYKSAIREDPFSALVAPFSDISSSVSSVTGDEYTVQEKSGRALEVDQAIDSDFWDGDLTSWSLKQYQSEEEEGEEDNLLKSDRPTFTVKDTTINTEEELLLQREGEAEHDELFWDWWHTTNTSIPAIPLKFSERRTKSTLPPNSFPTADSVSQPDRFKDVEFEEVPLHSPPTGSPSESDTSLLPTLNSYLSSPFPIFSSPDSAHDTHPVLVTDNDSASSEEDRIGHSDSKLPFDIRSLLRVLSVTPQIQKLQMRLHHTKRDFLYHLLGPVINRLAKRQMESAIRAVILNFLRDWLCKLLHALLAHAAYPPPPSS